MIGYYLTLTDSIFFEMFFVKFALCTLLSLSLLAVTLHLAFIQSD